MKAHPSRAGVLALVVILLAGTAAFAHAKVLGPAAGFPRLGLYGSIHGNGTPFWNAPTDTTFDPVMLAAVSRYDEVILDVSPITPYRPSLLDSLRGRNPDLKAIAYLTVSYSWPSADADSLNHIPTRYRRLVRDLGGFLYNSIDGTEFHDSNINLAKKDANGNFFVAESLADFFASAVIGNGNWDGMFLDTFCTSILWLQDATHQIDYVRAGYSSLASFDYWWAAACDTLVHRLRREVAPGTLLIGNCCPGAHHDALNGTMRENFPFQAGGSWLTNMTQDPGGYLADDRDYLAPAQDYLTSWPADLTQPYSSANAQKVRFGLGSAALGSGYGVFNVSDKNSNTANYETWWYDEYAVDPATAQSATDLAHTHWLGLPLGPAWQDIWAGNNPDVVTNPGFETDVTTGWNFNRWEGAAATLVRDTTTSAVGRASAHLAVTAIGPHDYDVNLTTPNTMAVTAGATYSATFWARASAPRQITVAAVPPAGGGVTQTIVIGDTWQHYQVPVVPNVSTAMSFEFFFGQQVGDLWVDDVHFQLGTTSVWRRDFENGVVLVNPSATPMNVPLGGTFRHILGTVDPLVNDGSSVTTAAVRANDALFLIGAPRDTIPPAAIRDARVQP